MKRFALFFLLMHVVHIVMAQTINVEEATEKASIFLNSHNTAKSAAAKSVSAAKIQPKLAYTAQKDDETYFYVFNNSTNNGFVIIGGDETANEILGYSDQGAFVYDNIPSNMKWWLSQYVDQIHLAKEQAKYNQAYSVAMSKAKRASIRNTVVEPLVTAEWDQLVPYNLKCTDRGSNFGVYTGCVATAMAQVMHYHKYPVSGIGEHEYQFPAATKTYTGHTNFSEHTYAWDKMLDTYASYNNPAGTEDAVATLMHDCGVSVDMNYQTTSSSEGSGASNNLVAQALVNYFGYDRGVRCVTRVYYSDDEWEEMMISELAARRPVIYSAASSKGGGHEFVMDGYDGNGYFHFNWGWSGSCNGHFLITGTNAINPYTGNDNYGSWGEDSGYAFNISQAAVIGIQPDKGTKDTYVGMGLPGGYSLTYPELSYRGGSSYQIVDGYLWNTGVFPIECIMGLKYVKVDDPNIVYYDDIYPVVMKRNLTSYAMSYNVKCQNIVIPGKYYAYPVFRDAADNNAPWQDIALPYGFTDIPVFTWNGSELALTIEDKPYLTSNGEKVPKYRVTAKHGKLNFTIKALSDVSREVKLEIYNAANPNKALDIFYYDEQTLSKGNTYNFEYALSNYANFTPGEYFIKIRTLSDYTIYPTTNSRLYFTVIDPKPGDVNGDGVIAISDLTHLVDIINGKSKDIHGAGDLDNDNTISLNDIQLLIDAILQRNE